MKKLHFTTLWFALLGVLGCKREYPFSQVNGLKPVYMSPDSLPNIYNLPPQPVHNTGPVFLQEPLFFMVEMRKGIHVFNVLDTANPIALTFIKVPAITDFTLSGNTIYADNGPNLVTLNIADLYNVQVISTQKNVFMPVLFPNNYSGWFECVDTKKGIVIDWENAKVINRCRTTN